MNDMAENKVVHAAQRAAFSVAIDAANKAVRGQGTEHMTEEAVKLINLAEPLLSKRYKASAFDAARKFVQDPMENGWSTRTVPSTRSILIF